MKARVETQRELIQDLFAHVEEMEGRLCHCRKGKAREPLQEVSPILGSPLNFGRDIPEESSSDDSYRTPPIAGSSSSPLAPSSNINKENSMVLYNSRISLVKITDSPVENVVPVPVQELSLDFAGISRLIAVRGQRAIRSQGHPKLSFHPYTSCCRIGQRFSSHRSGNLCLGFTTEGGARDEE